jgi:DNA invertase Pin-like site-specific DNA recombinase
MNAALALPPLAVLAEYQAKCISERTTAALAARRRRNLPLGNPDNLNVGNSPAPEMNRAAAKAETERL